MRSATRYVCLTVATVSLLVSLLVSSCWGWKGEPEVAYDPTNAIDTAYNDVTYTAVTSNISSLSAVSCYLNGYVNASDGELSTNPFSEFGFLLSRFVANPTYDNTKTSSANDVDYVKLIQVLEYDENNTISAFVDELIPYTEFYYRTYAIKDGEIYYGVVRHFITQSLTTTMYVPTRYEYTEVDLAARVEGLNASDYGDKVYMSFQCRDVTFEPLEGEEVGVATYDTTIVSVEGETVFLRVATPTGMTPGKTYYARAFMTLPSEFYVYADDNLQDATTGAYEYGQKASDIVTCRYVTSETIFTTTELLDVVVYNSQTVEIDYDAATIVDCYFTLPQEDLVVTDYGVALVLDDGTLEHYQSADTEFRTGRRYSVYIDNLELDATFSYIAYITVLNVTFYSVETYSFATLDYTPIEVDLGLSVIWSDRNVGAYEPYIAGCYYAWGEVEQKSTYTDESYSGPSSAVTEISGTEYDVAAVKWGSPWRIPTTAEIDELYYECDWEWTKRSGVYGFKITGPNDNSIFLPAGGMKSGSELSEYNSNGYYWTSERVTPLTTYAHVYDLYIRNGVAVDKDVVPRRTAIPSVGFSVRPVRNY